MHRFVYYYYIHLVCCNQSKFLSVHNFCSLSSSCFAFVRCQTVAGCYWGWTLFHALKLCSFSRFSVFVRVFILFHSARCFSLFFQFIVVVCWLLLMLFLLSNVVAVVGFFFRLIFPFEYGCCWRRYRRLHPQSTFPMCTHANNKIFANRFFYFAYITMCVVLNMCVPSEESMCSCMCLCTWWISYMNVRIYVLLSSLKRVHFFVFFARYSIFPSRYWCIKCEILSSRIHFFCNIFFWLTDLFIFFSFFIFYFP